MKIIQKQVLWLLSAILITVSACTSKTEKEEKPPLVALEDFFKNADKTGWQISPDGEYISYRSSHLGHMNVFVRKISDSVGTPVTFDSVRNI
ncbi:MAG TPA: S9 family peptidase, partial [Ferruginibacter sp.]|nr:S9 family peptidase [Ferruginibacter sp.]